MLIQSIDWLSVTNLVIGFVIWFIVFYFFQNYLYKKYTKSLHIARFFIIYFIVLSAVGFLRVTTEVLPKTIDSVFYLSVSSEILQGNYFSFMNAKIYGYLIAFIRILTFSNLYILIVANILFFLFAVMDILTFIPHYRDKNLTTIFIGLFSYISIYWFMPNVLREAIFLFFLVKSLKFSLRFADGIDKHKNVILFLLFGLFAGLLRPQIFPLLGIWLTWLMLQNRKFLLFLATIIFISLLLFFHDFVQSVFSEAFLSSLKSYKTEAVDGLGFIAFEELIIPNSFFELVVHLPFLVFRFLFTPFPWDLSNVQYFFAYVDALFICVFVGIVIKNILQRRIWDTRILAFSALFLISLGVFEIAFTGAVRHRMPYILIMFPFLIPISNNQQMIAK